MSAVEARLCVHAFDADNRSVHLDKRVADLHPNATTAEVLGLLEAFVIVLPGIGLEVTEAWVELLPAAPEEESC